jgi:hypothetical protein
MKNSSKNSPTKIPTKKEWEQEEKTLREKDRKMIDKLREYLKLKGEIL